MDEVNPDLDSVDVCLVIGANDITNKAACDTPGCPIYGPSQVRLGLRDGRGRRDR